MQAAPTRKMAALGDSAPAIPARKDVTESLEVMLEAGGPASVLLELAEKQAKAEEDNEAATKSPLLQALLQVSLSSYSWRGFGRTMGGTVALYRWRFAHN